MGSFQETLIIPATSHSHSSTYSEEQVLIVGGGDQVAFLSPSLVASCEVNLPINVNIWADLITFS